MTTNVLPISDRNLILTGYTGPNQPFIGRQVAEKLRMRLVNLDARLVELTGLTVDEIRRQYGQARLKTLEAELVAEALLYRQSVIRINGHILLESDYLPRLQQTGSVICLVASLGAVLQRLHLSLGARYHNPNERAQAIGHLRREWAVRQMPGVYEIDTTYLNEAETVETVINLWQQVAIVRG